jgi:predicted lipoprotein with Yx(FWY)xxD motif
MTPSRSLSLFVSVLALPVVVLAVAGCGGGGNSVVQPKTSNGRPATIGIANTGLGSILVDAKGRTLYLFQKDVGTKSACTGACATDWPPLRAAEKPTLGSGANPSLAGTTPRSDGTPQVIYNRHPLYLFSGDQKSGDTNGQGVNAFGGLWYVLSSSGNQITTSAGSGAGHGY